MLKIALALVVCVPLGFVCGAFSSWEFHPLRGGLVGSGLGLVVALALTIPRIADLVFGPKEKDAEDE